MVPPTEREVRGPAMPRFTRHPRSAAVAHDGQGAAVLTPKVQEWVTVRHKASGEPGAVRAAEVADNGLPRHCQPPSPYTATSVYGLYARPMPSATARKAYPVDREAPGHDPQLYLE